MEQVFRDMKSILETRPIYHQTDEAIRGHVFCSFLALLLRKELNARLEKAELDLEWADVKQDLAALHDITIDENGINRWLSGRNVSVPAAKSFSLLGSLFPPRSGKCNAHIEKNVVPRLF